MVTSVSQNLVEGPRIREGADLFHDRLILQAGNQLSVEGFDAFSFVFGVHVEAGKEDHTRIFRVIPAHRLIECDHHQMRLADVFGITMRKGDAPANRGGGDLFPIERTSTDCLCRIPFLPDVRPQSGSDLPCL